MSKALFGFMLVSLLSTQAHATSPDEIVKSTVREVTSEYANQFPLDAETAEAISSKSTNFIPSSPIGLGDLITLGQQIWKYVLDNKPNAQFQTIKTSIVPNGITNWTQLSGWRMPVTKVYRVEFKNMFGSVSGGFDYRITFVPGGNYQGKGKFLGNISFMPMNIQLSTGRTLDIKAELSNPLNFGTAEDPIAGAQMLVSWTTPTLTHYQMDSAEYFLYGTGDLQDLSSATP